MKDRRCCRYQRRMPLVVASFATFEARRCRSTLLPYVVGESNMEKCEVPNTVKQGFEGSDAEDAFLRPLICEYRPRSAPTMPPPRGHFGIAKPRKVLSLNELKNGTYAHSLALHRETESLSVTLSVSFLPRPLLRRTFSTPSGLSVAVRDSASHDWRPIYWTPSFNRTDIIHIPISPAALLTAELLVSLSGTRLTALVPLAQSFSVFSSPSTRTKGYIAPLVRNNEPCAKGHVTVHAAPTPATFKSRKKFSIPTRQKSSPCKPAWGLDLALSHAASVARDVRGTYVTISRVCCRHKTVIAKSAQLGKRRNEQQVYLAVDGELLRHCCVCPLYGCRHAATVEWRRGRGEEETVFAALELDLDDWRILHEKDILECVWGAPQRGGRTSRTVVVSRERHGSSESYLNLLLTR